MSDYFRQYKSDNQTGETWEAAALFHIALLRLAHKYYKKLRVYDHAENSRKNHNRLVKELVARRKSVN
jgi:hypothetical protein